MSKDKKSGIETLAAKANFTLVAKLLEDQKPGIEIAAAQANPAIVGKILKDDDGRTAAEISAGVKRQDVPPGSIRNNPNLKR